jgi:iron complex outermembrane receptor protein
MTTSGKNKIFRITRNALAIAISAGLATQIQAQEATSDQQDNDTLIEEVIVTATKREASIQEIGVAVTALGQEAIDRGGIIDITRLDALVPGMQFGSSGNEVRIALRGTRQNNVGTEAEQAVGIFNDGVYVPTSTQAFTSYVDVKRVEVLRGPQGTLYGRNTFGGTINVITNQPTFDEFYGSARGIIGDYNRIKFEAIGNIPISDTFAIRLAAMADRHDGYIENTWDSSKNDDLNDSDIRFGRMSALWQMTESLDALLRITYNDSENNGSGIWGYQQIGGYRDGEYSPGNQYPPDDASDHFDEGPWKVARNGPSFADTRDVAYTLETNWDADFATLKFIGNYTDFDGSQFYDSDYSDGGDSENGQFGWKSAQNTWSTELQLISNGDNRVDWLAGFYYYKQTSNWNWLDLADGDFQVPHWDNEGDYKSDSLGIFGNATFDLNDNTRLVGGLRYAKDTKKQRDLLDWGVFPPVPVPDSGLDGDWSKWLWKAGIEYDINDDMMTYFTASNGYRAGGINFILEGVPLTYDSEEVIAYEVGYKSTLLDGTMVLNIAAYYNDYKDMQAQSFIALDGATTVTEYTENAGSLDTKGIEVELSWRPESNPNWNIGAQLSLMDASFGNYNISKIYGLGDLGGRQDLDDPDSPLLSLKGYRPALSPKQTIGAQIGYDFELSNGSTLTPYVQTYYSSKYYGFDVNVDGNKQGSYTKTDLRLIWNSANGKLEVQVFVLNVENDAQLTRGLIFNPSPAPDLASIQASWSNPRTWGISLLTRF